ncbi:ABC transporter permease [Pseudacidobacterium ailaaui]|jgi:predicted permease|uniref:ABC transporter permease n=1 Tax=Pseudacidobacterium ailaaui TaxID=1382359 RepID=UPI0005D22DF6|nr:ABC transporter permease [Pseudacidobacterium ailaaui]
MRVIVDDIRYGLRQFRKAPGFTITAVLTLALGIGATTAIFTLIHAVLLKSLPVTRPEDLIRVGNEENCCINGGMQDNWSLFSFDQYKLFRDNNPEFQQLAAFQAGRDQISVRRQGSSQPAESFISEFVSGNAFDALGIQAYAGRLLQPSDDQKGAAPVAVMSFRTWQQKYGQDPSIVGASFMINGFPYTLIGIAPPGFYGDRLADNPPSFWLPLSSEPQIDGVMAVLDRPDLDWLNLLGRIRPNTNLKQLEARMQVQLRQWMLSPQSKVRQNDRSLIPKQTLHLSPGGGGVQTMRDQYKDGLRLLMWISSFVLLIACANLANLMLARAATRRQQTSVRSALGAPRTRLIRQALTESVVLAVLGGLAGLAVAYGGSRLILHLAFQKSFVPIDPAPSLPVLGFAFAVSLLTGVLFGVAPAWMMVHASPIDALRGTNRTTAQGSTMAQKSLVVLQAAISLVLLCAAGLLTQSLRNMQNQHFGFETQNRYILHIDPQMAGYKPEQMDAFYRELHDLLAAIPGVKSVAYSLYSPMEGNNWGTGVFLEGQAPPPPGSNDNNTSWVRASADYFATIGTRIIQGRGLTLADTESSQPVAVVNKTFAKKFFKDGNAIGKHFGIDGPEHTGTFEIVGVTEDTQYWGPTEKIRPMFFLSAHQWVKYTDADMNMFEKVSHSKLDSVEIQTAGFVPGLEAQVRRAIAQVNPDLTVIDFNSFADQVKGNFNQQAMIARLTSLFGLVALALASIGLYGVTAYSVERRTSEIGIRMALGADRLAVLKLVLRGAFLQVIIGLAIGLPATILGGQALSSLLFGIRPYDPAVLLITTVILLGSAFLAAVIPARRAASTEPMQALRIE